MPTEAPARPASRPSAEPAAVATAARNRLVNLAALSRRQPAQAAALAASPAPAGWATARDGSLWGRDDAGRWLAGCSVPLLAGRALLRSLSPDPGGSCLLAPAHAGLVVAARERVGPGPVLFVVQPDLDICRHILAAADVSADLDAGRLWIAAGDDWAAEFRRTFDAHPGLAVPVRFVQTRLTPDAVTAPLIAAAQQVIGELADARTKSLAVAAARSGPAQAGRTLVVGGSRFRLWGPPVELVAAAAAEVLGRTVVSYDTGDPLVAAPTALAEAAEGVAAVVAADLGRIDAAAVLPSGARWVTWVTRPVVPTRDRAGTDDRLILADPAWRPLAAAVGWPADRIGVGRCPPLLPALPPPVEATLGLLCDTGPITVPDAVRNFSSHRLLWEAIAAELYDAPLIVTDAVRFVADRARDGGLSTDGLDVPVFVDRLILPAYAQGLARLLIAAGLPIRLWGAGWDELPEFTSRAVGSVSDGATFQAAVAASTSLVRHTPGRAWHPIDACGRPVLAAECGSPAQWLSQACAAVRSPSKPAEAALPSLAAALRVALGAS